jgi:hypothetical protein
MELIYLTVTQHCGMKQIILKSAALAGVIVLVAVLWPIFTEAETSLAAFYVIASAAGIDIAGLALFSKKRWLLWAALGVWPGAIAGGLVFAGIAFLTVGNGTTGWEGAIVAIVSSTACSLVPLTEQSQAAFSVHVSHAEHVA